MGLKETAQSAVKTAFDVVEDFHTSITVTRLLSGSFDPDTGDVTSTPDPQTITDAIVGSVTEEDRLNNPVPEQANTKILLLLSSLEWEPEQEHTVTISSVEYEILRVKKDIAEASLILYVET